MSRIAIDPGRLLPEPRGAGRFAVTTCPVCDGIWIPPPQSRLLCHARCLLSAEDQDRLLAATEADIHCTAARIASALGVTPSIVTANLKAARERREARRRAPTDPLRPR